MRHSFLVSLQHPHVALLARDHNNSDKFQPRSLGFQFLALSKSSARAATKRVFESSLTQIHLKRRVVLGHLDRQLGRLAINDTSYCTFFHAGR
jgi:hypothetical protein